MLVQIEWHHALVGVVMDWGRGTKGHIHKIQYFMFMGFRMPCMGVAMTAYFSRFRMFMGFQCIGRYSRLAIIIMGMGSKVMMPRSLIQGMR